MEIILDKGFLKSFFVYNSGDRHVDVFVDFQRFISRLKPRFKLVCNYESIDDILNVVRDFGQSDYGILLRSIIDKNPEIIFIKELNETLNEVKFYHQSSSLKLCLVDFNNKECDKLEKNYGYRYLNGENLAYKWKVFFSNRGDLERHITKSTDFEELRRFDSWNVLRRYKHPLNAILIVDKYILSDKTNQPIEYNLLPLLRNLLPDKELGLQFDLTIIASQDKESERVEPAKFDRLYNELSNFLKHEYSHLNINFSIIKFRDYLTSNTSKDGFKIHDRRIITNYYWIEAGIGFNIFGREGKMQNTDSEMKFKFNLLEYNYVSLQHVLKGYASLSKVATEVFTEAGSRQNRLLSQYHSALNQSDINS